MPVPLIIIDANSYLRFFDSNSPRFRQLLKTVAQMKEALFVTDQIVSEVRRNQVSLMARALAEYRKKLNLNAITLPIHFDADSDQIAEEWNKDWATLREQSVGLLARFDTYAE